ncbi:MAG TPA: class I SAM-dependent methyltransferase [Chloroflexi bacterium]|jgi:SAM-dependent methyltransferase|nr:class I SAM-dependent methyltransferase [Chloroflexota bacterium]
MSSGSMDLYDLALWDHYRGNGPVSVVVHRDDGLREDLPMTPFFESPVDSDTPRARLEQAALALCRGRVLDIGAGAGRHSLILQERGLNVCAIDIAAHAVDIMRRRGVREAHRADIWQYSGGPYDTLLMLMHGIGIVGTLAGLDRFLRHARGLTNPGGRIVLDSLDVRHTDDPVHIAYQEANRRMGRYEGEIRMRFEYGGQIGEFIEWLHIDYDTLSEHAAAAGWACRRVYALDNGDYLAELTRLDT